MCYYFFLIFIDNVIYINFSYYNMPKLLILIGLAIALVVVIAIIYILSSGSDDDATTAAATAADTAADAADAADVAAAAAERGDISQSEADAAAQDSRLADEASRLADIKAARLATFTCKQGTCLNELKNTGFRMNLQHNGNLVVTEIVGGKLIWNSATPGIGVGPYRLIMKPDGNLVIWDSDDRPTWKTNTENRGVGPYKVIMQEDGNLVIYGGDGNHVWQSKNDKTSMKVTYELKKSLIPSNFGIDNIMENIVENGFGMVNL